ncbi:MAG: peptidoglycan-binding domain-containing protein [Actinomycetota bacterium]
MKRLGPVALGLLAVVASACTAASLPTTTSTSSTTSIPVATTLGGRITLIPNSTAFISEGERGPYVEALQFYLVCTGHDEPTPGAIVSVDGSYGPITADAVAYYQAELRRVPSGDPDEETFASLSRDCNQQRTLAFAEGVFTGEIGGNVTSGDDEVFQFAAAGGQVLALEAVEGLVAMTVFAADGSEVTPAINGTRLEVELDTPQAYTIRVTATVPTSYRIATSLRSPNVLVSDFGPMSLEEDGIGIATLGEDPVNTVAVIALLLGPPFEDSGWETDAACTGTNRHVSWLIQGDSSGTDHPAIFTADFTDTGGTPYFSQYAYISNDLPALDPIARGLTTEDGLSIGSTYDEYVVVYDEPTFEDTDRGLVHEGDLLFGIVLVGGTETPDGAASRVWHIGAGADGCPDFSTP